MAENVFSEGKESMQAGVVSDGLEEWPHVSEAIDERLGRPLLPSHLRVQGGCLLLIVLFFIVDIVVPRGATPAIGYCLVPVLARNTHQRRFVFLITATCTVMTWIGYFLEPMGAAWWMSIFDRAMVTGVLWLTLFLVWRRMQAEVALAGQARALREAVSELRRSNSELENFASVVSHDIRGPLQSIDLLTSLMSSRPHMREDAQCTESVSLVRSEIARISDLVASLLDYGRVGGGELKLSDCDFNSVLTAVRQALRAELEAAGAEITNDPLPVLPADPALMGELFQNLIENSIKYRGPFTPRIHVSASAKAGEWSFAVSDNGIGIAAKDYARVFEPFYTSRSDGSAPGNGLGLATCKRIVERHGGRISVQSIVGEGTTFSFTIPTSVGDPRTRISSVVANAYASVH